MTDLAQEDRNAIVSALRDTEAPVEDTAEELPTEDASPEPEDTERPRDEKGRFKSPEEKIATAQEKFQGDPEKAWQAVVEAQELMGRQAQELGEMRKLVENIPQQINQQAPPPNLVELIDENPEAAVRWAVENQQQQVFQAAMRSWFEQSPYEATEFRLEQERQAMGRAFQDTLEPVLAQTQAGRVQQQAADFFNKYPDASTYQEAMAQILQDSPEVAELVTNGNPAVALEFLYLKAKAQAPVADTPAPIAPEPPEPAVLSGGATVPAQTEERPLNKRIWDAWQAADISSLRDG